MANKNNVYIGNRYVPVFADPVEWDNLRIYEPLTIVTYQGTSYTSKKAVPAGIALSNTEYWVATGNYNAQVEQYRQEVAALSDEVDQFEADVNAEMAKYLKLGYKVVDASGNGDYTTISAALSANPSTARLLILPGTYREKVDFNHHQYVSLIGIDKEHTVITYDSGVYKDSTVLTNINFEIRNLTIEAKGNTNFTPTFDVTNVLNTFPSYALHADGGSGLTSNNIGLVENCNIISSAGPAVGSGVQSNGNLTFDSCYIFRSPINNSYKANNGLHDGALLIHCANAGNTYHLGTLRNNIIECSYYPSLLVRCQGLAGENGFELLAQNNQTNNGVIYLKGTSALSPYSNGNENQKINANKGYKELKNANLSNGSVEITFDSDIRNASFMQIVFRQSTDFTAFATMIIPISTIMETIESNFPVSYTEIGRDQAAAAIGMTGYDKITCACSSPLGNAVSVVLI
jgi:hypothetical protein